MNPFSYPDRQHLRTQKPDRFTDYRRFKPFLRIEFGRQCVYCRLPDGLKGEEAFGVDHYRPASRFPDLALEYGNLFYACNTCNWRKGDYWPASEPWDEERFIPNPCAHRMAEHLQFEGTSVEPLTHAGRFTIELLFLNDPADVAFREFVLRSIQRCMIGWNAAHALLADLDERIALSDGLERRRLLADRSSVQDDLEKTRQDLDRLTSRPPLPYDSE